MRSPSSSSSSTARSPAFRNRRRRRTGPANASRRLASSGEEASLFMFYVSQGNVPHKRHTQHRAPDGSLYAEELFGVEGFTGRSSLLYHVVAPTRVHWVEPLGVATIDEADDGSHHHSLVNTKALEPSGDVLSGRIPLFFNADVVMGVIRPAEALPANTYYRNGEMDEMLFVHEGAGVFRSNFGDLRYEPGDYIVIPIGTTWRLDPSSGSAHRLLYLE